MLLFVVPVLLALMRAELSCRSAPQLLARAQQPILMASPLRVRERTRAAAGWIKGRVLSTQNALLEGPTARDARNNAMGDDDSLSPAVLSDDVCLVPGSPVVRVEVAPGNARRIFTGIDIVSQEPDVLEVVWQILTDYENLAAVVPNLVANDVIFRTPEGARLRQGVAQTI